MEEFAPIPSELEIESLPPSLPDKSTEIDKTLEPLVFEYSGSYGGNSTSLGITPLKIWRPIPIPKSPKPNDSQESQYIRASAKNYVPQNSRDITATSKSNSLQQPPDVHLSSETNNNPQEYQQVHDTSEENTSHEYRIYLVNFQ